MRVRLDRIAHARSGDKGDASNVGLIADSPELFELLREQATAERVKEHFGSFVLGPVERYEAAKESGDMAPAERADDMRAI